MASAGATAGMSAGGWGAAAQLGGELIGAGITAGASAKEAKKARKFIKKQMQTKYQWQVRDMKAAGLNPILAANASPGMGGTAQAAMPLFKLGDIEEAATAWATRGARRATKGFESWKAHNEAALKDQEVLNARAQGTYIRSQTAKALAERKESEIRAQLMAYDIPYKRHSAEFDDTWLGRRAIEANRTFKGVGPLINATPSAKSINRLRRGLK